MSQLKKALDLASRGLYVFPVGENDKRPLTDNGFYAGTTDESQIRAWWSKTPKAGIGVWTGASGVIVLDVDVKEDSTGNTAVDGFDSLDVAWLDVPTTFSYYSASGKGAHFVYTAPDGVELGPTTRYRNLPGIDRRSGGSYVVWAGDVPASRDEFSPAPEWLCDPTVVRSRAEFDGSVEEWFASLEPGEPNRIVRDAIARVKDDFTHAEMVSAQHEAIRLGCEANPGVPQLIARLEEAWMSRPAEHHSTPTDQWEQKFAEALSSGVQKFGDQIAVRKKMPEWSLALVPPLVSDNLVSGAPGDKQDFNRLLREMVLHEADDYVVLSVMWNAPKTRDLAHEWGLLFTYKRVTEARITPPPERENPTLDVSDEPVESGIELSNTALLTEDEIQVVLDHPTFIDQYCDYSYLAKGWVNKEYAVPNAWAMLSMAFGHRARVRGIPLNLWFITLGYSGTGKTVHFKEVSYALDLLLKKPEQAYFNLGAGSSPEAMHEALLERDGLPSMVLHDEASDFFENLSKKEWMSGLKDNFSKWYDGYVPPVNKVRLKELKGKSARTSYNLNMVGTPDRLLSHINGSMFESGFLARVNWVWGTKPPEDDTRRFRVNKTDITDEGFSPVWYDCVNDILYAQRVHGSQFINMDWTPEAEEVLVQTHMTMDRIARERDAYHLTEPAVTRLNETAWKCAALLALWRGDAVISYVDALTAVYYVQTWFDTLFRIIQAAGKGEFAKNLDEVEAYIRRFPKGVGMHKVYNRFVGLAKFSTRDVDNLIEYLEKSHRVVRSRDGKNMLTVNG